MKEKFKIGDRVKCIKIKNEPIFNGCGWKLGLVFTITRITNGCDYPCYFNGFHNCGVFEPHLRLDKPQTLKELIQE